MWPHSPQIADMNEICQQKGVDEYVGLVVIDQRQDGVGESTPQEDSRVHALTSFARPGAHVESANLALKSLVR